jgi:hypothetical protein
VTGRARDRLCGMVLAAFAVLGVRVLEAQIDPAQIHQSQVHAIEIVADKDSRYKSPDGGKAEITLKAGEQVLLRVSAQGKIVEPRRIDPWLHPSASRRPDQSARLEPAIASRPAGIPTDRSLRTG